MVNCVEVFFEACEVPEEHLGDSIAECEDRVGILEAFKDGEAHEDDFAFRDGKLKVSSVGGGCGGRRES